MKSTIKVEEMAMPVLGIYLFSLLNYQWWWFLLLILTPDFGMIGYLFGSKIGAMSYNVFHHKGIAVAIYILGICLAIPSWQLAGVILFSHAAMDRVFGYGLKYEKGFKYTHLGEIGK